LEENGELNPPVGQTNGRTKLKHEYKCLKRGHLFKAPGLSLEELEKLKVFWKLRL